MHWVGSSKKDLLDFPDEVVSDVGYALGVVQQGGVPPSAKHWKGEGTGVLEIVEDHRGDAFRVVYTIRFERAIYGNLYKSILQANRGVACSLTPRLSI